MNVISFGANIENMLEGLMAPQSRRKVHIALRSGVSPEGLGGWFVVVTSQQPGAIWLAYEAVTPDLDEQVKRRQWWVGQAAMLRQLPTDEELADSRAWRATNGGVVAPGAAWPVEGAAGWIYLQDPAYQAP